ncbi:hypothetical protein MTP99_005925 [Tenebrio molitor]|jgi:hypothetical protein|nr:hypothetical protein MTP99_005925 [Tenebrio molitor]
MGHRVLTQGQLEPEDRETTTAKRARMEKTMRIPIGSQPAGIKSLLVEITVLSIYPRVLKVNKFPCQIHLLRANYIGLRSPVPRMLRNYQSIQTHIE